MFFNKKKIIAIISLLLAVCVFASCGGKPTKIDDSTTPSGDEVNNDLNDLPNNTDGFPADTTSPSTVVVTGQASVNITTTPTRPIITTITTKKSTTTTTTAATTTKPASPIPGDGSQMSLKEIQDSLFAAEDAGTAGKILTFAGFEYDQKQGIYYSHQNPLQRKFGFHPLYDSAAPFTGMIYYTRRVFFQYDDRDWMVQVWKGQYGITVGAEIGIYNKPIDSDSNFYDCAGDEDLIEMSMIVYKGKDMYFTRGPEKHWWLTGFKLLDATNISEISVQVTMKLEDKAMANAMEKGLKNQERDGMTYVREDNTFTLDWPSTKLAK